MVHSTAPQYEGNPPTGGAGEQAIGRDFYAGYREGTRDFELRYQRRAVPIDDTLFAMRCIRVASDANRTDLWKTGYLAGFFASFYGVVYRWTVSSDWTPGEMARVAYRIDCIGRVS